MREILFRGKAKDGKWYFGDFVQFKSGYVYIQSNEEGKSNYVIPETVGQFTGLTDKNGKKIFEGDIIKIVTETDDEEYPFVAEFFEIMFDDEKHRFVKRSDLGIDDFDYSKDEANEYKIEVVGNIYDTHELLED